MHLKRYILDYIAVLKLYRNYKLPSQIRATHRRRFPAFWPRLCIFHYDEIHRGWRMARGSRIIGYSTRTLRCRVIHYATRKTWDKIIT